MKQLLYATGNDMKLRQANQVCRAAGIELQRATVDIPEIQAEDGELIARDKAAKAFAELQQPLVISDDTWFIPGLNNFPGPYMKSMDHWFSVDNWLDLTRSLSDRSITLRQIVVYQDATTQQAFSVDIVGELLPEARGGTQAAPCMCIVSFDGGQTTVAEINDRGESALKDQNTVWHSFTAWYESYAQ